VKRNVALDQAQSRELASCCAESAASARARGPWAELPRTQLGLTPPWNSARASPNGLC
jgi:hypothetical protein